MKGNKRLELEGWAQLWRDPLTGKLWIRAQALNILHSRKGKPNKNEGRGALADSEQDRLDTSSSGEGVGSSPLRNERPSEPSVRSEDAPATPQPICAKCGRTAVNVPTGLICNYPQSEGTRCDGLLIETAALDPKTHAIGFPATYANTNGAPEVEDLLGIARGLQEMQEGKTKPIEEIRRDLKRGGAN